MAAVNAWIHYKLVNVEKRKEKCAWYNFFDSLADGLMYTNCQAYVQSDRQKNNEYAFNYMCSTQTWTEEGGGGIVNDDPSDHTDGVLIGDPKSDYKDFPPMAVQEIMGGDQNKRKGLDCKVCFLEGRWQGRVSNVVVCLRHRLRLCTLAHPTKKLFDAKKKAMTDYSWQAPSESLSCW